jgi:dTDP-L-rhamnose 4-epimerase
VTGRYRVGDIRHCFADMRRAKERLGIVPQVSLATGLARFCAWAESQPVFEDGSNKALAELRARNLASAE